VDKWVRARAGISFSKKIWLLAVITVLSFALMSCASSDVSRDTSANIDLGMQNARNLVDDAGNSSIGDSYQNASQAAKGAIIGGTAGAVTGLLSPPLGFFPGTAIGMILGAAYGGFIDSNTDLNDQLANRGANVVVLGDQILIVLPSARIFQDNSSTIRPQAYTTLKLVARYINGYTKMLVKVAAYTDATGSNSIDLALSQQQADQVAKFLLASGMDSRVLYAAGYGGTHLVQKNTLDWNSDNYRIEITLEKLYV